MHRFLWPLFGVFTFTAMALSLEPGLIREASAQTSAQVPPQASANTSAPADSQNTAEDTPLIELYPFPVWYQRFEKNNTTQSSTSADHLVVLDPQSGRVSRFDKLHFADYPTFHVESLGGVLHLRLEGTDDRQAAFKRWYLNPQTGDTSEVLSPTGEAQSDQFLQCDGQQRQHWIALGDRSETSYGVAIFDTRRMKTLSDWQTPTDRFPLPTTTTAWRTCHHQTWMVAYQRNALHLYDPTTQKHVIQPMPEGVIADPLNLLFRDQKLWVWWRVQQTTTATVSYSLWQFDLQKQTWQRYPEQALPFLPLQDLTEHELLLGPPWLPSDYRAPYFRLNTLTGQRSTPIWVHNVAPGQLTNRDEVWQKLTGPISE